MKDGKMFSVTKTPKTRTKYETDRASILAKNDRLSKAKRRQQKHRHLVDYEERFYR